METKQCDEKFQRLLGRLCLSIEAERLFKKNKKYLASIPNVLDEIRDTNGKMREADVEQAAAFIVGLAESFGFQTKVLERLRGIRQAAEPGAQYFLEYWIDTMNSGMKDILGIRSLCTLKVTRGLVHIAFLTELSFTQ